MKAAVLSNVRTPLVVRDDIDAPDLVRGQVLVQLAYSGVCHSQVMEARGKRGDDAWLPHLLGHEGTGRVLAVGEGVTKVAAGDLVILGWIRGLGLDAGGAKYRSGIGIVNAGAVTTFNEMAVVSENRIVALPEGVPLDVGVLFGCAVPTGAGLVLNEAPPPPGATVAVFGLGGIGLSAVMATQLFECAKVIGVDISDEKLALARSFGATDVINAGSGDVVKRIRQLTDGHGVSIAIEASGSARVIEQAFESVRRSGGLCVFASHPEHGERVTIDPYELICGKQLRGSWGGRCSPDVDVPRFAELYRQGRLPLERLITKRYRLENINDALDDLERGRVGRPLIEINPNV